MAEGLVKGEGFATDASVIKADANRQSGVPGTEALDWLDKKLVAALFVNISMDWMKKTVAQQSLKISL